MKTPALISRLPVAPRPETKAIPVTRVAIEYDPSLNERAGYLAVADGDPPLAPTDRETLLHLLFFAIYTKEGRELLRANSPARSDHRITEEDARTRLHAAMHERFAAIPADRIDAAIDMHFAADLYVYESTEHDDAGKTEAQALYSQKLLMLLGALYDDAMSHEFSMGW